MIHELKCWPVYFEHLYQKPFEIRKTDRDYQVGDKLLLREWDPTVQEYTGRQCTREVTYILAAHDGLQPGYAILGLAQWQSATFPVRA